MERDDAWQRVFQRLPVLERIDRDGIFHVSADELKTHGGREPRLMAKIDTLAERPAILAEHALALFPVRNGHYVLFPDPAQKSFFRFSEEAIPPLRPFRSKIDLNLYDTFPRGQESSESRALDMAFISSMLTHFCDESEMHLTIRGRFFSGGFNFRLPIGGREVEVNRVQIEVDAGYEGAKGIYLIEAKRGRREDFHIRQLWYPWLHWSTRTRKRVMPIFFTYSNGQYFLTEMAFGQAFGELSIIRNRAYCLEESPLAELDLGHLLETIPLGPEPAGAFPQANDLDKVVDLVQATTQGDLTKTEIAELFGFEDRQADYYGNAGCYLGLLQRSEGNFVVTGDGLEFSGLRARAERTKRLVTLLIGIPSFRSAIKLLVERNFRVEKIANQELAEIILRFTGLGGSTPLRRASTVRAWLVWIMSNMHLQVR